MVKSSDRTHKSVRFVEDAVLPTGKRIYDKDQIFSNEDDEFGPPLPTSSSEPTYRSFKGNLKHDNSVHKTNTLSFEPTYRTFKGNLTKQDNTAHKTNVLSSEAEHNEMKDSFNDNVFS